MNLITSIGNLNSTMKIKVEKLPKSQVKISISVPLSNLGKYEDQVVANLSSQTKISGFREGKAPKDVLIQHVGEDVFRAHVLDAAIPGLYMQAVDQEKIDVVSRPEIKITKDDPFEFEATVAILPEVKLKDYSKVKVKMNKVSVSDKEVDEMLKAQQMKMAAWDEVKTAAKKDDKVEIDFDGFDKDGKPLPGTQSKNHPVVIGSNSLIPGFEDNIIGMKPGDEKEFDITFPKDYHSKDFKGKKVKFKIKLHKTFKSTPMPLDDNFAKHAGMKDMPVKDLKVSVKDMIQKEKERGEKVAAENEVIEALLKLSDLDIPAQMIEDEIDFFMDQTRADVEKNGIKFEDYVKSMESQGKNLREEFRERAEKQIRIRFVVGHINDKEKLEVTDKEIEKEIEHLVSGYPERMHDEVRKDFEGENSKSRKMIENRLRLDKFFNLFIQR